MTTKETLRLNAEEGWNGCQVLRPDPSKGAEIRWQRPGRSSAAANCAWWLTSSRTRRGRFAGRCAWKACRPSGASGRSASRNWPWPTWVRRPRCFCPAARASCSRTLGSGRFEYRGTYPSGWTSMQLLAAYDADGKTGLYVAMHDPLGEHQGHRRREPAGGAGRDLGLRAPGSQHGRGRQRFRTQRRGRVAASARRLVRRRDDLPRLGSPLCPLVSAARARGPRRHAPVDAGALGLGSGRRGTGECAAQVKEFQKYLGVPIGFHWYSWHQIPFDNDYPHYFPAKPGFAEAVRDLQASGVYVMPYINGRLWDTHDRGREDFEFTRRALPAATKDEQGKPYIETYGSKESDGSPVRAGGHVPDHRALAGHDARDGAAAVWRVRREGRLHGPDRGGQARAVLRSHARPSPGRRPLVDRRLLGPSWTRSAGPNRPTACSPPSATPSPTRRSSTAT